MQKSSEYDSFSLKTNTLSSFHLQMYLHRKNLDIINSPSDAEHDKTKEVCTAYWLKFEDNLTVKNNDKRKMTLQFLSFSGDWGRRKKRNKESAF